MVTEHEKRETTKQKKPRSQSLYSDGASIVTKPINMSYLILKGLTCRVVEVELLATMPISEGIQTQTLALEVEVGI